MGPMVAFVICLDNVLYLIIKLPVMTAAQSFKIYEVLGKHFNNAEDAKIVVTKIEQIIESKIADKKDTLATKEDILAVKEDVTKLETKIAETKVDLIKWVFTFFAALAVMITGLYLKK